MRQRQHTLSLQLNTSVIQTPGQRETCFKPKQTHGHSKISQQQQAWLKFTQKISMQDIVR